MLVGHQPTQPRLDWRHAEPLLYRDDREPAESGGVRLDIEEKKERWTIFPQAVDMTTKENLQGATVLQTRPWICLRMLPAQHG
mmetsp:Transcript_457/g.1332  ORF Transcript_457/g.1332 Transcript_457/m.1332 type:complete len:83 (-) Transcript_457:342-590(-)